MPWTAAVLTISVTGAITPAAAHFAPQPPKDFYLAKRIAEIREATARYEDLRAAQADGYRQFTGNLPLLGTRFVSSSITTFVYDRPTGLIYAQQGKQWLLAGVEYAVTTEQRPAIVPFPGIAWREEPATCRYTDWHEWESPRREGCPAAHPEGAPLASWQPTRWVIRAWVWYPNPSGMFAPTNPLLAPYGDHPLPPEGVWTWEAWERFAEFSRRNHMVAGWIVLLIGAILCLQAIAVREAPWLPLAWTIPAMVLGVLIVIFSDRDAWPVGEMSFARTVADEGALEHKSSGVLVFAMGLVEFLRYRGALIQRAWGLLLPALAITAGVLLLGHDHTTSNFSLLGRGNLPHITEAITAILIGVTKISNDSGVWRGRLSAIAWPALVVGLGVELLLFRE